MLSGSIFGLRQLDLSSADLFALAVKEAQVPEDRRAGSERLGNHSLSAAQGRHRYGFYSIDFKHINCINRGLSIHAMVWITATQAQWSSLGIKILNLRPRSIAPTNIEDMVTVKSIISVLFLSIVLPAIIVPFETHFDGREAGSKALATTHADESSITTCSITKANSIAERYGTLGKRNYGHWEMLCRDDLEPMMTQRCSDW